MKVLHINTTDTSGSAIVAKRLVNSLRNNAIDANLLVLDKSINNDEFTSGFFDNSNSKTEKIVALARRHLLPSYYQSRVSFTNPNENNFTFPRTLIDITNHFLYNEADIVHFHQISEFVDIPSFFKNNDKPLIWTLHDFNPFSGGNHLPNSDRNNNVEVEKYATKNLKIKADAYAQSNKLIITAPSFWLSKSAENSGIFQSREIHTIPNGINIDHFKPYPMELAKDILKIRSGSKKTILFIADDFRLNNKGAKLFAEIYRELGDKYHFVIAGKGINHLGLNSNNITQLGYINSEYLLPLIYSSCDISLVLSEIETFSLTTLESLSCGVPVISTNCNGPEELIDNNKNGIIVHSRNPDEFVANISDLLSDNDRLSAMKISAINKSKKYNIDVISEKFIELYKKLIN